MQFKTSTTKTFQRFLLSIVLLELFIGGGGRLLNTGSISIRMFLFAIILFTTIFMVKKRITNNRDGIIVIFVSILALMFASIIGYFNGASIIAIFIDLKPLLFITSILYFFFTINELKDVELIIKLLKFSSLFLAISYVILFVLINFQLIPFLTLYKWAESTEEFFFRGEFAFFYKGFLFMCTGTFFYFWDKRLSSKILLVIIAVAILLTFTRGFILAFGISSLVLIISDKSKLVKKLINISTVLILVTLAWSFISNAKNLSFISNNTELDRDKSDYDRVVQINEVIQGITPSSFFIGHGFGIGVPSRPVHMEISYLEIFHKQGVIGLLLWASLFTYGIYLYKKVEHIKSIATPFYLSFLFVFAQSLTNPFINNPIGLTMIILCLSVFKVLSKENINIADAK